MNSALLDILVCPVCKSNLHYQPTSNELICRVDRLSYPVKDDIPIMLESEAKQLSLDEIEKIFSEYA